MFAQPPATCSVTTRAAACPDLIYTVVVCGWFLVLAPLSFLYVIFFLAIRLLFRRCPSFSVYTSPTFCHFFSFPAWYHHVNHLITPRAPCALSLDTARSWSSSRDGAVIATLDKFERRGTPRVPYHSAKLTITKLSPFLPVSSPLTFSSAEALRPHHPTRRSLRPTILPIRGAFLRSIALGRPLRAYLPCPPLPLSAPRVRPYVFSLVPFTMRCRLPTYLILSAPPFAPVRNLSAPFKPCAASISPHQQYDASLPCTYPLTPGDAKLLPIVPSSCVVLLTSFHLAPHRSLVFRY
jgi:hypothetical protein